MSDSLGSGYWKRRASRRSILRGGAVGAFGLAAAALVGCGEESASTPTATATATTGPSGGTATGTPAPSINTGGRIVTSVFNDPVNLNPQGFGAADDYQFFWTMTDNLVAYNRAGELDSSISLAEKWEIVGDGTRINLTLREGISFHDGTPLNAEAVEYNILRVQDPEMGSSARGSLLPITGIETSSDNSISLTLDKPNAALLYGLGDRGGALVSPASIEQYGEDLPRNVVGTGPFILKEWRVGNSITVVKNPDYWGRDAEGTPYPYLDEVTWNVIPDATVAEANLSSGTLDILVVPPTSVDRLAAGDQYRVQSFVGTNWTGDLMNHALEPLDDIHFRRAMAFAIDKAAMSQAITAGKAPVAIGILSPASWAYNPNLKGIDFDLDEARRELAMSKYPEGATLEYAVINRAADLQAAELRQQMLKAININLNITAGTTADVQERMFRQKSSHMNASNFGLRVDPDGVVDTTLRQMGLRNPGNVPNPKLDELIDAATATYDIDERREMYDQIQQIAIDEVYQIYNFYGVNFAVAPQKVNNLETLWGAEGRQRYKELWLA